MAVDPGAPHLTPTLLTTTIDKAATLVDNRFTTTIEIASAQLELLNSWIEKYAGLFGSITFGNEVFVLPDLSEIEWADVPEDAGINYNWMPPEFPPVVWTPKPILTDPGDFDKTLEIQAKDMPSVPTFNGREPSLNFGTAPSAQLPPSPGDPPTITDEAFPPEPPYDMPGVPTLTDISIPALTPPNFPVFDGTRPQTDLLPPDISFTYNEQPYQSEIMTPLIAKILNRLNNGGTGLDPDVEAALWARARDRQELENVRKYNEAETFFAARGWNIPPGALSGRLMEILKEIGRSNEQLNYEITIEQAKLANENERFNITSALQFEQQWIQASNAIAQRSFEAARATVSAAVEIFTARVSHFNTMMEAYKTDASIYESKLRAEVSKLEAYKLQLEEPRMRMELNKYQIELYDTRLKAVQMLTEIYKTRVQVVGLKTDIQRLKLDAHKTKVEIYTAQVNAKTAEYGMYQARIQGEVAKVQAFEASVRAYTGQIDALKAQYDMQTTEIKAKIEVFNGQLGAYNSKVEVYKSQIQIWAAQVDIDSKKAGIDMEAWKQNITLETTKMDMKIKTFQSLIDKLKAQTDLAVEKIKAKMTMAAEASKILAGVLDTVGKLRAQIVASALGAVSAQASLQGQGSDSYQSQYSEQYSEAIHHQYNHTLE